MFVHAFFATVAVAATMAFKNQRPGASADLSQDQQKLALPEGFSQFQRSFLCVALLAWFSDWLQGAYIYDLYSSYGYDQSEIAQLFVAGFLSSMVVGSYVGAMADKYGRRKMCSAFAPFSDYSVLMVGRVLGGVATSLLFTVFESWMVCEHRSRGYPPALLSTTFSRLTAGNGLAAVTAGLVANGSTQVFGTPLAPFMVACAPLLLVSLLTLRWPENYGDSSVSVAASLKRAWSYMCADARIVTIGLAQALFEAGMYVFVFIWTPALLDTTLPEGTDGVQNYLGIIFAAFMTCTIIGSNILEMLMAPKVGVSMYDMALIAHMVAALALTAATVAASTGQMYLAFLAFEVAVGMFYPAYSMIKSSHIQEEVRSTVMNYFRIPLNAFVALALVRISQFSSTVALVVAACLHVLALCIYIYSRRLLLGSSEKEDVPDGADEEDEGAGMLMRKNSG
ncbi:hypothetical protein JKP88DRAFT_271017 [Tribonema minus]|uniref:Molybdate-anion transporter n=1 Tax=Tribonema minus TaxID=303371 RepID=A0A835YQ80_9STRA|nr:hypothetical protein JKP88DRAFT_271017 [Tribonema minus]